MKERTKGQFYHFPCISRSKSFYYCGTRKEFLCGERERRSLSPPLLLFFFGFPSKKSARYRLKGICKWDLFSPISIVTVQRSSSSIDKKRISALEALDREAVVALENRCLQGCSPGFLDFRFQALDADRTVYQVRCTIWFVLILISARFWTFTQ